MEISMDTAKNKEGETILKGLHLYRTLFSHFFRVTKAFNAFQLCKVQSFFISEEWKGTPLSHPWEKLVLLSWAKASVVFLPLDYQRQPEDPLSTNAPSWARSCRHRVPAQVPWPRGRWRQWCQQMEPKIIPGRGFLCKPYKYRPYRDYCTGLSFVTNSSAVTPGCLLTQHCPQNPLSNIPLIFPEVCSRRILHRFSVSKKTSCPT